MVITDLINPGKLVEISKQFSSLSISKIDALAKKLCVSCDKDCKDECLFDVLYKWHRKNPMDGKGKLAKLMNECGCHKEALALDPSCKSLVVIVAQSDVS